MTNSVEDVSLRCPWKESQCEFLNCHVGQNLTTKFICGLCKILALSRAIGLWPRIVRRRGGYLMMNLKGLSISPM